MSHAVQMRGFAMMKLHDPCALTLGEQRIARLLTSNLSTKQIATQLAIKARTVSDSVHRISEKLGVFGRANTIALLKTREVS